MAEKPMSLWAECFSIVLEKMREKGSRTLKFDDVDHLISEKAAHLYPVGDGKYEYRPPENEAE